MALPEDSRFSLAEGLTINRILNSMWQVSGAHGSIEPNAALRAIFDYPDAGFTTWELAGPYNHPEDPANRLWAKYLWRIFQTVPVATSKMGGTYSSHTAPNTVGAAASKSIKFAATSTRRRPG